MAGQAIRLGRRRVVRHADSALLGRVRRRMVLWYAAVLAAGLLLFGVILYVVVSQIVLRPVSEDLSAAAQSVGCPFPDRLAGGDHRAVLWACFDTQGHLISESGYGAALRGFAPVALAHEAAANGTYQDIVTLDGYHIERYAAVVPGPLGTPSIALVGEDISGELHSLHVLLLTLLGLGAVMILASTAAGYFLAGRALIPVRVAQTRQQEFIADASHELRTPLTLLRADAEILLRNRHRLPAEDAELLDDVVLEADHMTGLADSMLQLARLDSGDSHMEREVIDLSDVVEAIARRALARASELGLTMTVSAPPRQLVLGDRLLINQAVLAVVDNALKYNHRGGAVHVEVQPEREMIAVRVRDTGPGIADEHIQHLGKRFYRVDKARSRALGGAGLGLSIVSRIASQHGGGLSVQSEPGEGTTVSITFPRP